MLIIVDYRPLHTELCIMCFLFQSTNMTSLTGLFSHVIEFEGKLPILEYYPEDNDFLLEFEPTVVHYDVVGHS